MSVCFNEDGREVTKRVIKSPFCGVRAHFDRSSNSYITKQDELDSEDQRNYDELVQFVDGFVPAH